MEKIAIKLMEFGMDFQYENFYSDGEQITSFDLGIKITNGNGKISLSAGPDFHELEENDNNWSKAEDLVEQLCIEETN